MEGMYRFVAEETDFGVISTSLSLCFIPSIMEFVPNNIRDVSLIFLLILQSAVEYIHAVKENGKIVGGSEDRREQAKYNVELVYIQDQDMIENQEDAGLGLNCPNCGAPLPGLGAKKCIYCDTPIVEYNLRIWNFSRVEEA